MAFFCDELARMQACTAGARAAPLGPGKFDFFEEMPHKALFLIKCAA